MTRHNNSHPPERKVWYKRRSFKVLLILALAAIGVYLRDRVLTPIVIVARVIDVVIDIFVDGTIHDA